MMIQSIAHRQILKVHRDFTIKSHVPNRVLITISSGCRGSETGSAPAQLMKIVDLKKLIEGGLCRFAQSGPGDLQPVVVTIPPDLPKVYWEDDFLQRLLAEVFRTTLRSTSGQPPIRIAVRQRKSLPDLETLVGVIPVYWIQIEISGRGVWSLETLWSLEAVLQSKSEIFGYHCEQRKTLKGAAVRLAVFCASSDSTPRMAVYVSKDGFQWNCDFLIPVLEKHLPDAA